MVSAIDQVTAKLGEKRIVQRQAETITGSSLQQQLDTKGFALEALRRKGCMTNADMLEYPSTLKLVDYLRHRNPFCWATVATYLPNLNMIFKYLGKTPDELVAEHREDNEETLEQLFLTMDQAWIQRNASPSTRIVKWSCLNTFLKSNGIRKVKLVQMNIRNQVIFDDEAMTQQDCRKALKASRSTQDRLLISLVIESLQRAGTIGSLTWGDVRQHIESGETVFLIKIDAKRTKRNIVHWVPIGTLSSYYIRELAKELKARGIELRDTDPLIASITDKDGITPIKTWGLILRVGRILGRAGARGRKFGEDHAAR